ncbi:MAG: HAD family phosphatase [Atopobiaceae bacterium]|nr:HAD family phosphatase [Atopobiaceae bacterium]
MTKIFASDFDGTLYFHGADEPVRRADLDAIRAFQESGGLFGACTGRPLRGLTVQSEGLVPFDFYIALTGGTIFDRSYRPIYTRELPYEVVREQFDRYAVHARDGIALACAADDYWVIGDVDTQDWPVKQVATFDQLPGPYQGMGMETATVEEAIDLAAEVNATYGDVACAYVNLASIDILPAGCSKGTGLIKAAEYFGASLTGGIGDSHNDVPLLQAADVAYTFRRCDERVRSEADVLVDHTSEALADFMGR